MQKKLLGNLVIDVGYVGSKGTDLIVTLGDLNRPIAARRSAHARTGVLNARRPNQTFQRAVTADKSIGNSIYHSLQVKAERRMATGLTFLTAYTWSKSISGPSDIGGQVGGGFYIGGIQDVYNLQAERAVSGFDVPHRFVQTVLYDLPFFKSSSGFTKLLLDGWQMSTIVTAQSGFGAPIDFGVDTTGTGIGSRPDVTGQAPQSAGRPAHLDTLVQYSSVRRNPVRPLRHLPAHKRHPPAGLVQLRFLGEQNIRRERTLPP